MAAAKSAAAQAAEDEAADQENLDGAQTAEKDAAAAAERAAQTAAEQAAAAQARAATRLAWIVTYPAISVQPKDADGQPDGDPLVLQRGAQLPASCEWAGPFLGTIGHATALQVPA